MAHVFKITAAANEQFKFAFLYNAESIVWSENYKAKASAKLAIESIKKNAPGAAMVDLTKEETGSGYRFEIAGSKDGQFFVRFVASNGETMVRSETYKAKASAINAIESVKNNSPEAEVVDELDPLSATREMLISNPSALASQFRSISEAAKEKLETLGADLPNSVEGEDNKEETKKFLEQLSLKSDEISDEIESSSGDLNHTATLIRNLSDFVSDWISRNAELIRKFRIVGLIGLSCAILNFLGCTPEVSSVTSTFLFGGRELAEYVAAIIGSGKKPK